MSCDLKAAMQQALLNAAPYSRDVCPLIAEACGLTEDPRPIKAIIDELRTYPVSPKTDYACNVITLYVGIDQRPDAPSQLVALISRKFSELVQKKCKAAMDEGLRMPAEYKKTRYTNLTPQLHDSVSAVMEKKMTELYDVSLTLLEARDEAVKRLEAALKAEADHGIESKMMDAMLLS